MDHSYVKTCSSPKELATLRSRVFILVDQQSDDGCWLWLGPRHSSGAGKYLWRIEDGGNDKYILAHRVVYYAATGELPRYLKNLCGSKLCVKASHYWTRPSESWRPKRKAIRGRIRQLSDEEVRHVRLLSSLGGDEAEIGQRYRLTARQTADIALGKVRSEAGGRIRPSRFKGIRFYHDQHEQELRSLSMRPDEPPPVEPQPLSVVSNGDTRPFPHTSYGHAPRRRLRW